MSRQGGWEPPPGGKLPASVERPNRTIKFGAPPPQSAVADGTGVGPASEAGAEYRLGARLGQAGEVYEAQTPRFQGRLAMKLYRRATGLVHAPLEAFARDAARASALRHPHIAHVLETGTLRDGTPFVTTEYLTGQTLEEQLAGRGAFLPAELLPTIRGLASALSAAHAAGLVHRELRPDNVFLAVLEGYESGFVKLLDFGACHLTAAQRAAGREVGARTTRFFAPEQLGAGRVEDVDARADQFALAAITYRMLSGADPSVAGAGAAQAVPGTQAGADGGAFVTPLARRAPSVDAVVSKALSRGPQDRFASVSLFLQALEEALTGAAMIVTPGPARVGPSAPGVHQGTAAVRDDQPQSDGDLDDYRRPPAAGRRESDFASEEPRLARGGIASVASVRQLPDSHATIGERRGAAPRRDPSREPFERPSLTQQFFAEGERQEATSYKNAPPDPGDISASLEFESFDRVPKRRKPLVAAVLVTLIGLGGLAWWAGFRPPQAWRESTWWRQLRLPDAISPAGTASEPPAAADIAAPPAPQEAPGAAPVAPAQSQPAQTQAQTQTDAGGAAGTIAPTDGATPPAAFPPDAAGGGATPTGAVAPPGVIAPDAGAASTTAQGEPPRPVAAPEQRAAAAAEPRPGPRRRKTPGEATTRPSARRGAASESSEPWPSADPPKPPPLPPPESRPGPPPFNPEGTMR